jgi:thioredoxin-dependent peroxiredoxin
VKKGDIAPDFELPDQTGAVRRLSDELARGPVVLFFYPAAMTPGCTRENCHFRDLRAHFEAVGASRIGISADGVERQLAFAERDGLDFPLLSDPRRTVARTFGVTRFGGTLPNRRSTFVIDRDGTVLSVFHSELHMNDHGDRALALLRSRQ